MALCRRNYSFVIFWKPRTSFLSLTQESFLNILENGQSLLSNHGNSMDIPGGSFQKKCFEKAFYACTHMLNFTVPCLSNRTLLPSNQVFEIFLCIWFLLVLLLCNSLTYDFTSHELLCPNS